MMGKIGKMGKKLIKIRLFYNSLAIIKKCEKRLKTTCK
jgi:hypothetical protein